MVIVECGDMSFGLDKKLAKLWEKNSLANMKKQNTDRVYIVVGRERSGKSTWAVQQMAYLDPKAFDTPEKYANRVCFNAEQFNHACRNIKNGVVIFDEAFRGLSSRAALSKVNKGIIQTLMEMGQNNNIVFIVLPSLFLLDIYAAMIRSDGLFQIDVDYRTKMRAWYGYSKADKNRLYQMGAKKGWSYHLPTKFKGRFPKKFPFGEEFEKAYLKKKESAFTEKYEDKEPSEDSKYLMQRNLLIKKVYNDIKSVRKTSEVLNSLGVGLAREQVRKVVNAVKAEIPPLTTDHRPL